jgi:prepilin-type N-terminal cleavage/methylation domain-containing protein
VIRRGFTLIELLTVIVIIGILLAFILTAAMDSARRADERATQSLITKLEAGLNDRLEALLQTRPDYNNAHFALGAIYNNGNTIPGFLRSQVIALTDYVKNELPDVFFVQNDSHYPLNFGANPYPGNILNGTTGYAALDPYAGNVLPTGNDILGNPQGYPFSYQGTGIFGASYPAAAGIYKNLGYSPQGYDGIDNDGNGLIDDLGEAGAANLAQIQVNLNHHKHITARSEMLYALLVEGRGPLGSVFNRDDFTDKEVQDTDNDGLPEFVDAWAQPLQFFRWPLLFHSDLQRGQAIVSSGGSLWTLNPPYLTAFQQREQDPLDPNQQLMAPAWWSNVSNTGPFVVSPNPASQLTASNGVCAFEFFFHRLTEPYPLLNLPNPQLWDRGSTYAGRRAFYSKFLILSSGPDQLPGVFLYTDADVQVPVWSQAAAQAVATLLIFNENNALPFSPFDVVDFSTSPSIPAPTPPPTILYNPSSPPARPSSSDILQAAQDDITNQTLQSTGGIGGSG